MKSKLFVKVLGIFGLLVILITVMTLLILDVFNQVEKNFGLASADLNLLNDLERLRHFLSDMPAIADLYLVNKSTEALAQYESGKESFDFVIRNISAYGLDSLTLISIKQIRDLYYAWRHDVGDKKIALAQSSGHDVGGKLLALGQIEAQKAYLTQARALVRELYRDRMISQPKRIQIATNLLRGITNFIGLLNVTLVFFAVVLGFVLTRSITKPVHLLIEGTRNIMSGKFETINLKRSDELGQLASDFNRMSIILRDNYHRLNAYSELVTALNTSTVAETVEQSSLELMCHHVGASVGALYLFNEKNRTRLELAAGYSLKNRGAHARSYALGEGIPGQCAREKRMLEVNDVRATTDFAIDTGLVTVAPRYVIAVPMIFQDEVLGIIVLGSMSPFDDLKKDILSNSVPQIGIAITNVRNVEATQKLSQEIAKKNEELNAKNVELEKAYKVKSDFLSSMSHELRTPLNSIIGFTSILLGSQAEPLTDDQRRALEKVLRNGKHLLQLINDILDFSKIESGRMPINIETDEVESVVASAVTTVEALIKSKNLQLTQSISRDLPKLRTDVLKVKQILVNLLSNAAKFTDHGSISIRVASANGMITFEVEDTGIGIEEKNLELVFQEFQQIDSSNTRKHQGTGLGLPISRRLARMLGGDLRVRSQYGKGSVFTLALPPEFPEELKTTLTVLAPPPAPQESKPIEAPTPHSVQILCIDDDPDVLEILRNYLIPEGYSVVTATSGDEGIEIAARLKPSLITLDIMMPRKDGWQVLRELKNKRETKDIPVLIHSMIDNKPLAISLGAVDVLPKPVDAAQLLSVVRKVSGSRKEFVLVVDDSEDFCETVTRMLQGDGIQAKCAYNGREALNIISREIPALILLDLLMPVMDGFQFIREMQENERWKKIPVVILSAKEVSPEEQQELNKRIVEFMHKRDFSHEALSKTVSKILGRS